MMNNLFAHPASAWVLTWLLHSTVLLGSVWLFERVKPHSAPKLREYLWRLGLVVSFASATVVTTGVFSSPLGQVELERPTVAVTAALVKPKAAPLVSFEFKAPVAITGTQIKPQRTVFVPKADTQADVRGRTQNIRQYVPELILLFWGLIISFLMVRFSVTLKTVIGLLGNRQILSEDHRAHALLGQISPKRRLLGLPKLTVNAIGAGPVSLPGNEICLPQWAVESLSDAKLKAVLAHELAHCLRFDAFWLLATNVLRRVFFFQPLLHIAHYRLSDTAEMAADEMAVQLTGDEKTVAASLTECAGRVKYLQPAWGAAMASNPSSFLIRVRRLLQPENFNRGGPGWRVKLGAFAAALTVAVALPSFTVAGEDDDKVIQERKVTKKTSVHRKVSKVGGTTTIKTDNEGKVTVIDVSQSRPGYALKVKGRGDFELNDAEDDLDCMLDGAKLEVEENLDGTTRKVLFKGKDGNITRTFWVNGKRVERDRDTDLWLSEMLPRLMRETGLNPQRRVQRLHHRGGTKLVLKEIGQIHGDYSTRGYIESLVQIDDLNNGEFDQLMGYAADIDSDFETRQTLIAISNYEKLTDDRAGQFLVVAENIDSDFELRTLSVHLMEHSNVEHLATPQLIKLIGTMDSDFEMRSAFTVMLRDSKIPTDQMSQVVQVAADKIDSDFELRTLLQTVEDKYFEHPDLSLAYIDATGLIDSDFERRQALSAFAARATENTVGWSQAIQAAAGISGDFECAEALTTIVHHMPTTDKNVSQYREALSGINAQFERKRAEDALDKRLGIEL